MLKLMKSASKADDKKVKKGNIVSDIDVLETTCKTIETRIRELENDIESEENAYKMVASDKVERRIKAGVNQRTIDLTNQQIALQEQKKISTTSDLNNKIEKYKKEKQNDTELFNSRKEKLEKEKETKIKAICELYDAKIEKIDKDIKLIEIEHDNRIEGIENKITNAEENINTTIKYYTNQLNRYYEEVPLVINYPPGHFKKIEEINQLKKSLEHQKHLIQVIKNAELEHLRTQLPEKTPDELALDKRRQIARQEALRDQQIADEKAYNAEVERNTIRQQEYKQEEERVKNRNQERPVAPIKLAIDDPEEVRRARREYYDRLDSLNILPEEVSDEEVSGNERPKKQLKQELSYRPTNPQIGPGITTYPKPIVEDE